MAIRPVRGVLVVVDEQTGDGRLVAGEGLSWVDPPLPLAWLVEEQHGDLSPGAQQIGTIDTIAMAGSEATFTGSVDDEIPAGAELIRRLDAGTAAFGNRVGVSIDPDDWAVELVDATGQEGDIVILASAGRGQMPVRAAAGDPMPPDGVVVYEDSADAYIERYTRLRIRGATCCAVPAFAGAYMELAEAAPVTAAMMGMPEHAFSDDNGDGMCDVCVTQDDAGDCTVACGMSEAMHSMVNDATTASAAVSFPARPPAAWFTIPEPEPGAEGMVDVYGCDVRELLVTQPDGGLAVPLTIGPDGRVFGHAARWGQCHIGYPGQCVTAPESNTGYAHYHVGSVETAEGHMVATGTLTVGCDHAAAEVLAAEARDHYAHAGLAWADVRASNGALGVWVSGALRPSVTEDALRVLRASSLSGDWRRIGAGLEFIGALAVSVPGFPVAREAVVAAAIASLPPAALAASAWVDDGVQMSLVASGVVQRCPECQRRAQAMGTAPGMARMRAVTDERLVEAVGLLRTLELRTRHLVPIQAAATLAQVKRS